MCDGMAQPPSKVPSSNAMTHLPLTTFGNVVSDYALGFALQLSKLCQPRRSFEDAEVTFFQLKAKF